MNTKKIFRISSIIPCLLCIAISFAQDIVFSCNFEDRTTCKWTQDSSDDFNWTRHQGETTVRDTGPSRDHSKGVGFLANKKQGPGSIQYRGGKCIHVLGSGFNRPKDGKRLVLYKRCGESRLEFQLWANGTLMHTRHSMCVKPIVTVTDGVRVGVFSNCDRTDKWSWTAQGSLKFKNKYCLKPKSGWTNPLDNVNLVLSSACESQNFFEFVPTLPENKNRGPGSLQHRGAKCIHVPWVAYNRPKDGQFLVVYQGCRKGIQEFHLWPNGTLMHIRYGMCVKPNGPVTNGVKVGVFSSCDATDRWSWTAQGSLQYKKKMCLKPETGGASPGNDVKLVLDSVCDERQNFFEFVPTLGWYLYIETSFPRQPNDTARFISPTTTKVKSCLLFFYHMYGRDVNELRVYVKSGGKMGLPVWNCSGNHGDKWYQAQVAVNNQTASYQYIIEGVRGKSYRGDIAIDDISVMVSCPAGENQTCKPTSVNNNGNKKVTTTFTVSTTPASSPSQTSSEDKGTTDDASRIIIIATTVGAGVFLSIVLIVLLIKYKRRKQAPKLSTPVNIPLEANEISPEPLPVDEEAVYETVPNVDRKFYEDVATNANKSEEISTEGRTPDHEEVEVPSNAQKASGHTELNKRPDSLKREATGDGDYQARLKEDNEYVISFREEPQHETSGQNETCEEPKLSPENPVHTELDSY